MGGAPKTPKMVALVLKHSHIVALFYHDYGRIEYWILDLVRSMVNPLQFSAIFSPQDSLSGPRKPPGGRWRVAGEQTAH